MRIYFLILLFAVCVSTSSAESEEARLDRKIKVGVSTVLTGDSAAAGQDVRDAILFANEKFGNGRYEIIIEDDKCSPKDAVSVAHKFISVDKVDYVIGLLCSGATLAAAPLYEKAKIVTITTGASSPKISDAGEFVFRTTPNDRLAAEVLSAHVAKKHSLVGVLSEETEYCQDLKNAFLSNASSLGLKTIAADSPPGASDYRLLLTQLKQKSIDSIFINTQNEQGYYIVTKQLRELGIDVPTYGAYWPGSPVFLALAKELSEGAEFVNTPLLEEILTKEGMAFFQEYKSKYGEVRSIPSIFASSVEAFRLLSFLDGVPKTDAPKHLYSSSYNGIFGPYTFDRHGEIEGFTFGLYKIEQGKAKPIKN